jgi:hypothetical protein
MGNSQSGSSIKQRAGTVSPARYVQFKSPAGTIIHAIGVYPCSTISEQEVTDLINTVKPAAVYVDVHPELLAVLEGDVRSGRFGDQWRIPEQSPRFSRYDDAGWLVSLNLRNLLADNELLALFGAEAYGPFKAAVRAALGISGPGAPALPAANGASAGAAVPTRKTQLLAFPLEMGYNNGETLDRPSNLGWMMIGNASTGSTAISALIGNPNSWFYNPPPADAQLQITSTDAEHTTDANTTVAPASAPIALSGSVARSSDVEYLVAIPQDLGYFTRTAVAQIQHTFRNTVNKVAAKATAASADAENDLLLREAYARQAGDAASADLFVQRYTASQRQSQAVAFHLQQYADELMSNHLAETAATSGVGPGSNAPSASASKEAAPNMVAVVNLGGLASLQRNWAEAQPPKELFPPFSAMQHVIGNALPVALGSVALYGLYRAGRRFPKTTAVFTVALGGVGSMVVYSAVYSDWTRYGTVVRASLARPRVTSPLTRPIK